MKLIRYSHDPIAYVHTPYGTLGAHDTTIRIGRDAGNDIVLSDIWVSSKHATIRFNPSTGVFFYEDHSTNGTWVGNKHVHRGLVRLGSREDIRIGEGNTVTRMRFESSFVSIIDPEQTMHIVPLNEEFMLGRGGSHRIPEQHKVVSNKHAIIRFDPGIAEYVLIDRSSNGTMVNGTMVHHGKHVLHDNDTILLAGEYRYVFRRFLAQQAHGAHDRVIEPARFGDEQWARLLEGAIRKDIWAGYVVQGYSGWKFHIFASDMEDLLTLGQVLIPEMKKHGIVFKTVAKPEYMGRLVGKQRGKAFTVYVNVHDPYDLHMVRAKAEEIFNHIHAVIIRNGFVIHNSHIQGDRRVPGDRSGRLFYRYDSVLPGPRLFENKAYRENETGGTYNIPNNPDIF